MRINCRDVTYHVEVRGQGEPILFLHGFTGCASTWNEIVTRFSEHYTCIMPDLLGHGETDGPNDSKRYAVEQAARDLKHILQVLQIPKVHVIGYSMGGRLALSFALLYSENVQTLTLESASPGLRSEEEREARRKQDALLAKRISEEGIASFVSYWERIPLFQSQEKLSDDRKQSIHQQRLRNSAIGLVNSLKGMGTGSQPSWWEDLHKLTMPVLLVTGELDQKFCQIASSMWECIPICQWQVVKEIGHAIHVEDSEKFGRIVSEFVQNRRE
ncbi:MAG: 2-succinyl-6-hydroxy-2,4-cyclohexadiene-1-carboxylate synthase [Bacillus sp. (in: firmicutes)]